MHPAMRKGPLFFTKNTLIFHFFYKKNTPSISFPAYGLRHGETSTQASKGTSVLCEYAFAAYFAHCRIFRALQQSAYIAYFSAAIESLSAKRV